MRTWATLPCKPWDHLDSQKESLVFEHQKITTELKNKETKENKNQTSVEMLRDEICGMM